MARSHIQVQFLAHCSSQPLWCVFFLNGTCHSVHFAGIPPLELVTDCHDCVPILTYTLNHSQAMRICVSEAEVFSSFFFILLLHRNLVRNGSHFHVYLSCRPDFHRHLCSLIWELVWSLHVLDYCFWPFGILCSPFSVHHELHHSFPYC